MRLCQRQGPSSPRDETFCKNPKTIFDLAPPSPSFPRCAAAVHQWGGILSTSPGPTSTSSPPLHLLPPSLLVGGETALLPLTAPRCPRSTPPSCSPTGCLGCRRRRGWGWGSPGPAKRKSLSCPSPHLTLSTFSDLRCRFHFWFLRSTPTLISGYVFFRPGSIRFWFWGPVVVCSGELPTPDWLSGPPLLYHVLSPIEKHLRIRFLSKAPYVLCLKTNPKTKLLAHIILTAWSDQSCQLIWNWFGQFLSPPTLFAWLAQFNWLWIPKSQANLDRIQD